MLKVDDKVKKVVEMTSGLFTTILYPVLIIQHILVVVSDCQWELPDHK